MSIILTFTTLRVLAPFAARPQHVLICELESMAFESDVDLAYAYRRLTFVYSTFIQPEDRDDVIAAIERLKTRAQLSKLDESDIGFVVQAADEAIRLVSKKTKKPPTRADFKAWMAKQRVFSETQVLSRPSSLDEGPIDQGVR